MPIELHGALQIADLQAISAGESVTVTIWEPVLASRKIVADLVARGEVAYGITTGFGEFAHVNIERDQVSQLQHNLLLSHAVGVGAPLRKDVVRAMMAIRINTLARGYSGIRKETLERMIWFLNNDIIPVVPSQGSVGSSGDLAPLSHMALPLIGHGEVMQNGTVVAAAQVLRSHDLEPLTLHAKEGLALINGTQMMSAIGALAVWDARNLFEDSVAIATMSLEALMGSMVPFDARVHALRPHPGQEEVARRVREYTRGSHIVASHANCERVQDAYSLRCIPQVLGAVHEALERAQIVFEREINSVTDNPLVMPNGDILSQGNFHGEPLAFQLDFLAIAISELANMSERRTERLVNPDLSDGLKPFLVDKGGLNSGFMIAQYTAASLVSENKIHSHPASVDSIPTSANKEDHNSMGSIGAHKLLRVLENARRVVAIEALCAAQALNMLEPLQPGKGTDKMHTLIRSVVSKLEDDRYLAPDVEALHQALMAGLLGNATRADWQS